MMRKLTTFMLLLCAGYAQSAPLMELQGFRCKFAYPPQRQEVPPMPSGPEAALRDARKALEGEDCVKARMLYKQALEVSAKDGKGRREIALVARYAMLQFELLDARADITTGRFTQFLDDFGALPSSEEAAQILGKGAWLALLNKDVQRAEEWGRQALEIADASAWSDSLWRSRMLQLHAAIKFSRHEMQEGQRLYRKAIGLPTWNIGADGQLLNDPDARPHKLGYFYHRGDVEGASQWYLNTRQDIEARIQRLTAELEQLKNDSKLSGVGRRFAVLNRTKVVKELQPQLRRQQLNLDLSWAEFLHGFGDLTRAEPLYRQLLAEPDADRAQVCSAFGRLLRFQKRYPEAWDLQMQALSAWDGKLAPDHPDLMIVKGELAFLAQEQGRLEDATERYRDLLQTARQRLIPQPRELADWAYGLAQVLVLRKQYPEALTLYQQALAWAEEGEDAGRLDRMRAPDAPPRLPSRGDKERMQRIWLALSMLYANTGKAAEQAGAEREWQKWGGIKVGVGQEKKPAVQGKATRKKQ